MKHLGIDYGSKRVGIAMSDEAKQIAFPRDVFDNNDALLSKIVDLIKEEMVSGVVIGDTRGSSGIANEITPDMEQFAEKLKERGGVPVSFVPEIWSSIEADRFTKKPTHFDAAAAAVILQRYLDGLRSKN